MSTKTLATAVDASTARLAGEAHPVFLDLGKKSAKAVKKLRKGKGRLLDDVRETLQDLQASGRVAANAQPVIVIVRAKPKKKKRSLGGFF
ncbi:hypothetical protein MYSTI_05330 [Myxococcus stipitatus DSM 14675]|uniref:Uncharacterized protein n=1 Tax=Myxococcus stipitatus (strain DSM 14675 / JCM 12634 / Mx s8) TaxID=1278073 RepID=L7UJI7_MYXSD|nr:hypothetical protein [Myxococcus stipitatus]AGC46609.1 hypothetical protein MYSTI_05330 [Myxococcus stipitatus DSM 14675]